MLLKELTRLRGVSGDEGEVRGFVIDQAAPYCDEIAVDTMGSVVAWKRCKKEGAPTVMIAAHMDEVGFMVQYVRDDGLIRYMTVGGIDPAVCVGKRVLVGKTRVPGVIGCKAVHLQERDERTRALKHSQLYIDIGARDRDDALKAVSIGDYAVFDSEYVEFGRGFVKSRALDDRVGCAVMLELLKHDYPCNVAFAFNVQEEVGLRGATTAGYAADPDMAIALDVTHANDFPRTKETTHVVSRLGKGAAVKIMDRGLIAHPDVVEALEAAAAKAGVPCQREILLGGSTDAAAIHKSRAGVPSGVISLPCRYVHAPCEMVDLNDLEGAVRILLALL